MYRLTLHDPTFNQLILYEEVESLAEADGWYDKLSDKENDIMSAFPEYPRVLVTVEEQNCGGWIMKYRRMIYR